MSNDDNYLKATNINLPKVIKYTDLVKSCWVLNDFD